MDKNDALDSFRRILDSVRNNPKMEEEEREGDDNDMIDDGLGGGDEDAIPTLADNSDKNSKSDKVKKALHAKTGIKFNPDGDSPGLRLAYYAALEDFKQNILEAFIYVLVKEGWNKDLNDEQKERFESIARAAQQGTGWARGHDLSKRSPGFLLRLNFIYNGGEGGDSDSVVKRATNEWNQLSEADKEGWESLAEGAKAAGLDGKSSATAGKRKASRSPAAVEKKKARSPVADKKAPAADKKRKKALPSASKKKKSKVPAANKKKRKPAPSASKKSKASIAPKKRKVPSADKKKRKVVPAASKKKKAKAPSAEKKRKSKAPSAEKKKKAPVAKRR